MTGSGNPKLQALIEYALKAGATGAVVVSSNEIVVDEALARRCLAPRCENYGLCKRCPPHVGGPLEFKDLLKKYSRAIFFKIDLPSEILYSSDSREVFQLLHEMASGIEKEAMGTGFSEARAYAGGSCKAIFCRDHLECLALSENGKCRNAESARPSMSGFGIHVAKLFEVAGWSMSWTARDLDSMATPMANVSGLVLIG
jgi:predicted metal-binding protein